MLVGEEDEFGNIISEPVVLDYSRYGHTPGKIVISLSKSGTGSDYENHPTETEGNSVESYTLTVAYVPDEADTTKDYHTTIGGHPGDLTDIMRSLNIHTINVFAKKLQINKVDQEGKAIKNSTATFNLYREALEGEEDDIVAAEDLPDLLPKDRDYILADTLTTDENGEAISGIGIRKLPDDAPYYLVEAKAPDGYCKLNTALEVRARTDSMDSSGNATPQDVWTKVLDESQPQTSNIKWDPYILSNWEQNATIVVEIDEGISGYVKRVGGIAYDHNETEDSAIVTYEIRNDAGARLPATGGPGTTLYTVTGIGLITLAAFLLWKKERSAR